MFSLTLQSKLHAAEPCHKTVKLQKCPSIEPRLYRKGMGNQAPRKMHFVCTVIILIAHNWVTYSGHGVQVVISGVSHVSYSLELNSVAVRTITTAGCCK